MSYVKSLVELVGLREDMWNELHDEMITEFLSKPEIQMLVFFVRVRNDNANELRLIATNDMPVGMASQFSYFVKAYHNQEINTSELFRKHVQWGTFGGKTLSSLLRLTSGLYAPLFFGNQNWPDSNLY